MKFSNGQHKSLDDITNALITEFKKPKSESQCITELKEIKQLSNKTVWDFDQRFKVLMGQVSFSIPDAEHKEWFIGALLPHVRVPMMQQKVTTQVESLEIPIKLEASPIGETGVGMAQIQNQLANLTLQLQAMKKGKEIKEEVWCIKRKVEGHHKDQFPLFQEYLATRVPNALNQGCAPWCEIRQERCHQTKN